MAYELRGTEYYKHLRYTQHEEKRLQIISRQELCKLRRRAFGNLTIEEFAEKCGCSENLIKRLESDKPYNPRGFTDEMSFAIFGVTKEFLHDFVQWTYVPEQLKNGGSLYAQAK